MLYLISIRIKINKYINVNKKVVKVLMFVWRKNNGKNEFFVLHRKIGDNVALTGHVGDTISGETIEEAAKREIVEELGVKAKNIINLNYSYTVSILVNSVLSTEHAFLIEIPNVEVKFLEYQSDQGWHPFNELEEVLTYDNQKNVLKVIRDIIISKN